MRCMSCQTETPAGELKFFKKTLPLCKTCIPLAESAERDVDKSFIEARRAADEMFLQWIMAGRLMAQSSGAKGIVVDVRKGDG